MTQRRRTGDTTQFLGSITNDCLPIEVAYTHLRNESSGRCYGYCGRRYEYCDWGSVTMSRGMLILVVDQTTKPIVGLLGLPLDISQILGTATNLTGSANPDVFEKALEQVSSQGAIGSLNEQTILTAHQKLYQAGPDVTGIDSSSIGAAASLQTLKSMVSGAQGIILSYIVLMLVGGRSDNTFVGMAMSEAAKRFDQLNEQGKVHSGNKEDAVANAAKTAVQLLSQARAKPENGGGGLLGGLLSSQGGGQGGGGGLLGGLLGPQGGTRGGGGGLLGGSQGGTQSGNPRSGLLGNIL